MKRFLGILTVCAAVAVMLLTSCHKVVRADVRALVDEINDSVMVTKIDGKVVKFDISEAKFTNGAVMYGDSVIVNYIGDLSMKRAFAETVWLIERPSQIIVIDKNAAIDPNAPVETRPADPRSVEATQKGLKAARAFTKKKK
jgi:hypothetical protein